MTSPMSNSPRVTPDGTRWSPRRVRNRVNFKKLGMVARDG
jgi:hypothetical protein